MSDTLLQTYTTAISTSMKRIAAIQLIIAIQSLRTLKSRKPSAIMHRLGDAYSRHIARHAAVGRQSRIILAHMISIAVVRPWREAPAGLIFVLELAVAGAFVEFRAVRVVGDAFHVRGAGGDFEATGTANFILSWSDGLCCGESGGNGQKDGFEKHCENC